MLNLIAGLFLLYLLLIGIKQFSRLSPAVVARVVRHSGGVLGMIGALLLLLRGSFALASLVASVTLGFAGWNKMRGAAAGLGGRGAGGQKSSVRSAMLEMELDHATGELTGIVLAGPFEGRALHSLTRADCFDLYAAALGGDPDGARLLETYLDRRFAGWRAASEDQADARSGDGGPGSMTEQQAYEVLGLLQGAGPEEVAQAHRRLMKKFHPDYGGSTNVAARLNQAKDVLLRRHRP
jgi:DnaJ-like protein